MEVVFDKKDMTEEEIRKIVGEFTDEDVIIESFEEDEATGETRVIIKFVDNEKAIEFVRNVLTQSRDDSLIRKVGKIELHVSSAVGITPSLILTLLIFVRN